MQLRNARGRGHLISKWFQVGDFCMHARVSKKIFPEETLSVVLVHGLVVSSRYMVPFAELLSEYFRVFALDLPGFGKSAKPSHVLTVSELANALIAWMDVSRLKRAAFLGNSLGCQIIVDAAMRHPGYFERAVLTSPTIDPRGRTAGEQVKRWIMDFPLERSSFAVALIKDFVSAGPRRFVRTFKYALEDVVEEKMPRVHIPTLVVRGLRDPIVSQDWAEKSTALLPNGRLMIVPGAPHCINYSRPRELLTVILPFLSEIRLQD